MSTLTVVAEAFAKALPATDQLTATKVSLDEVPSDALGVAARYVGSTTLDLLAVASPALEESLAAAKDTVSLGDVLHTALTQAGASIGDGVLHVDQTTASNVEPLTPDQGEVFVVAGNDAQAVAWLVITPQAATPTPSGPVTPLRVLNAVEMDVSVQIGTTRRTVRDLLSLTPGSLLELDRPAGAPADILVNNRRIARGEIVVVDEDYGVRITEVLTAEDE